MEFIYLYLKIPAKDCTNTTPEDMFYYQCTVIEPHVDIFLSEPIESTVQGMKWIASSSYLEVFVTMPRICHPLFPITHAATTKNNLLDTKISAIQKKVNYKSLLHKKRRKTSMDNGIYSLFYYM